MDNKSRTEKSEKAKELTNIIVDLIHVRDDLSLFQADNP
jgi:hypothetical protein